MPIDQRKLVRDVTAVLDAFRSATDWQDFASWDWFAQALSDHRIRRDGFDRQFLAALAYSGWFLFCAGTLTPKFHRRKMLIDVQGWDGIDALRRFAELPTETEPIKLRPLRNRLRKVLQEESGLALELAQDFDATLASTNRFQQAVHGRTWIEPDFAASLCELAQQPVYIGAASVQAIAWDLRDLDSGELLAADVGYRVGAVYSSMSGFSDRRFSSLGIVQLLAQLEIMQTAGVVIWDLGMPMAYKYGLGAGEATGEQWLQVLHACRDAPVTLPDRPRNLRSLVGLTAISTFLNER